jgi:hypothetical protein
MGHAIIEGKNARNHTTWRQPNLTAKVIVIYLAPRVIHCGVICVTAFGGKLCLSNRGTFVRWVNYVKQIATVFAHINPTGNYCAVAS